MIALGSSIVYVSGPETYSQRNETKDPSGSEELLASREAVLSGKVILMFVPAFAMGGTLVFALPANSYGPISKALP